MEDCKENKPEYNPSQKLPTELETLQQCKDRIAKKYNFESFNDVKFFARHAFANDQKRSMYESIMNMAAEQYASQFKSEPVEESKEDKLCSEFLYDIGSNRHLLNGETEPEYWEEMKNRLLEKWNIDLTRKIL